MSYQVMQTPVIQWVRDYNFAPKPQPAANNNHPTIACDWNILRLQLLQQWIRLTPGELEATGHNRRRIASLIQRKYGIPADMAENYLLNFERTLPLLGCA